MKVDFIGGSDVQRTLNHSDNKCINLVPALNDKGDIAAFYGADGLYEEATNPSSAIGSGIYTASNGRCFEVAGTTLYEITEVLGAITLTDRGTVTSADVYRMSDNGIELILVNGTDGWLFTFATNALQKIKVASADFTVTIADPAVFTSVGHTLVENDAIRLTSTTDSILSDSLLEALYPSTISTTQAPTSIAIMPTGQDYVYVSSTPYLANSVINMYSRNTVSGYLAPLSPPTLTIGSSGAKAELAISSDDLNVYATNLASNVINMFDVSSGVLSASTPATVATGLDPIGIKLSSDDKFAYVANYTSGTISQYSRNLGTGELTALTPATVACAGGPDYLDISTDVSVDGFVYVLCSSSDIIRLFSRNKTTGLLTVHSTQPTVAVGTGTTISGDIVLSPDTDNPHLYVLNPVSGTISMFSRNSTTGELTALSPATIATGTFPNRIFCTTESVYVTNKSSNTISQYSRDSSTGLLTALTPATIVTETSPAGILVTPDGNSVYVCNSGSDTVSMYSRNGTVEYVGLPTGLSELTTYYVIAAGLTADVFRLSETLGGTAVSTSGQQAGVHTFTTLGYGFPEGAKTVSYMNGRFVALEQDTLNFFVSEVLDGTWWDALNVQTVDSNPDNVVSEVVSHNELIVFCEGSGEVFYDSQSLPSPFVRNLSGTFEAGCKAQYSVCSIDNQVFWLGGDKSGSGIVYKLQGFSPIRISTHSVEYAIQQMSDFTDARGFAYQNDGHHYYVLSFPTGDKTFVYDINTGLWHERANFSSGDYHIWEATEMAYFSGKHLVLDNSEGKIYSISSSTYAYGSEVRKWVRSFRVPTDSMNRTRHTRLQLDCEVGVGLLGESDPQVMMRFSDDGGHTWSNERWASMGAIGEYKKRVVWHRLGMTKGQPRIYELSGTDPVKITLLNVHLD